MLTGALYFMMHYYKLGKATFISYLCPVGLMLDLCYSFAFCKYE